MNLRMFVYVVMFVGNAYVCLLFAVCSIALGVRCMTGGECNDLALAVFGAAIMSLATVLILGAMRMSSLHSSREEERRGRENL